MRGATRRAWIKLFITGWLHGSIRWQLDSAERGCFADLLCMAGECGQSGRICDNDGNPFPWQFVANQFNVELALLQQTITKCETEGRLTIDGDVIIISNWSVYQSEYERQKPSRIKKKKHKTFEMPLDGANKDLAILLGSLPGWSWDGNEDIEWLKSFLIEFPECDVGVAKACVDYHSGKARPHHKGVWKNRLRNWMKKAREMKANKGGQGGTHRQNPRQLRPRGTYTDPDAH